MMKRIYVIAAVLCVAASAVAAQIPLPPDESRTRGSRVPDISMTDDRGRRLQMRDLAGKPLLVSPIFTACPGACIAITTTLRDAIQSSGTIGTDFNVLTISFDPADTVEKMRAYREQNGLPDAWMMAVASPDDRMQLLDAIDFNFYSLETGGFDHVNVVAVLDEDLKISGYLHGTMHTPETVVSALQVAAGKRDQPGHPGNRVFFIGVAGIIGTALLIIAIMARRRERVAPAS